MAHITDYVEVNQVVADYFKLADSMLPSYVKGLYLVGSVALHDYQAGQSDIDFVSVTEHRPSESEIGILRQVHDMLASKHRKPYFDGVYLTREDLSRSPDTLPAAPSVHEHRFRVDARFALDPVTWHTLAQCGVSARGPSAGDLNIHQDDTALRAWMLENLDRYWVPWLRRHRRSLSPSGLISLGEWAPAWGALGVTRLNYTVKKGAITSKTGAGEYALDAFEKQWHRIVRESLRIRQRTPVKSLYSTPLGRRRDFLSFVEMVIHDTRESSSA